MELKIALRRWLSGGGFSTRFRCGRNRRLRFAGGEDKGGEAIPNFGNGLDVFRVVRVIVQSLPHLLYGRVDCMLELHKSAVRP